MWASERHLVLEWLLVEWLFLVSFGAKLSTHLLARIRFVVTCDGRFALHGLTTSFASVSERLAASLDTHGLQRLGVLGGLAVSLESSVVYFGS